MGELTQEQKEALDKIEKEMGLDVPIVGDGAPKKVRALGRWVIAEIAKEDEKTESGLYKPKKGDTEGYLVVSSVGSEVKEVKVGDNILAPGVHFQKDKNTGQIWAVMTEDLIVGVLEEG